MIKSNVLFKLSCFFFCACFWFQPVLYATETTLLSLEQCIEIALDNNIALDSAKRRTQVSEERIRQAQRRLWPTMSVTVTDNTALGDSGAFSQYDPTTGQRFVPGEGFQTSADLRWSMFDFGTRRSAIELEKHSLSLVNLSAIQMRRDIVLQVIFLYLNVLERQAELDVRLEQRTRALESLNLARGRLELGRGIDYEVLLEDAWLAQAEADLQATEFALNQAKRDLLLAMRYSINTDIEILPVLPSSFHSYSADTVMKTARQNRLEFIRYETEIMSYQSQLKTLENNRKPEIDFITSYSQQGLNFDTFRNGDISWSAGVSIWFSPFNNSTLRGTTRRNWINSSEFMQQTSISYSLNDGSSSLSSELDIRISIRRLQQELKSLQDVIGSEVYEAYEFYQSSLSILNAREKNLAAMEENKRIQQKRYELGLNHYKDVVDARAELIGARIALTRATYSMEQSRTNLEYVLGLLDFQEQLL